MPRDADNQRPARRPWPAGALPRARLHAMAALGIRLAAAGLAYPLQILLARVLGPADYGLYNITWNILTIGGFLATLGSSELAVRFLAQYHERREFALANGFLRAGMLATTLGALLAVAAGIAMAPWIGAAYGPLSETLLRTGVLVLPFFALTDFVEGVARSQGWTIRALAPPYVLRQALIILLVGGMALVMPAVPAQGVMIATVVAGALGAAAHVALVPLRSAVPKAAPAYDIATWRAAAASTLLSDGAMLARQHIDLILLGLFVSPQTLGHYFAATRLASLPGLIEFAVKAGMGHRFARAAQSLEANAIAAVYGEARRMALLPGLAASLLLILAAPFVLALFGPDFAPAAPLATLLIAATTLRLVVGPGDEALAMAGHPRLVWRCNGLCAAMMALATLLLAPSHGAMGAAIASLAGSIASSILIMVYLRHYLGIRPFAFRGQRP